MTIHMNETTHALCRSSKCTFSVPWCSVANFSGFLSVLSFFQSLRDKRSAPTTLCKTTGLSPQSPNCSPECQEDLPDLKPFEMVSTNSYVFWCHWQLAAGRQYLKISKPSNRSSKLSKPMFKVSVAWLDLAWLISVVAEKVQSYFRKVEWQDRRTLSLRPALPSEWKNGISLVSNLQLNWCYFSCFKRIQLNVTTGVSYKMCSGSGVVFSYANIAHWC